MRLLLAFILATAAALAQSAQPSLDQFTATAASSYFVSPNVTYGIAGGVPLKLDVYQRRDEKVAPVIVQIHGGGWVEGTKENDQLQVLPWLAMGYNVVNVEYRLGRVAHAPAAVEDCRCALKWVFKNADKYHFDIKKIAVIGGSAGGHLVLMTGMLPASAGYDRSCEWTDNDRWDKAIEPEMRVAAIVDWAGITDVADMLIGGGNPRGYAVEWIGARPDAVAEAKRMSPLTYMRPGLPPILMVHSADDNIVPYSNTIKLRDALNKVGVKNELLTLPTGKHFDWTPEQWNQVWATTRKFVQEQFASQSQ